MKLGKKLEVVNHRDRAKLLIDGVRMYTDFGGQVYSLTFDKECLYVNDCFLLVTDMSGSHKSLSDYEDINIWNLDWYYPVETYTVNGVELEDLRVKEADTNKKNVARRRFFVSSTIATELFEISDNHFSSIERNKLYIERSLLHATKKAAIAHSKALLGLPQNG